MGSGHLRNAPCWCGSGKKYKKCHLNRETAQPPNIFSVAQQQRKLFQRKQCLHPEAPAACKGAIVRAHTVRRRADLATIARDGHVYQGRADPGTLLRTGGRVEAQLIGIREASTFLGFCEGHDAATFAALETRSFAATAEQCFLLAYRALSKELYLKAAQLDSSSLLRDADKGRSVALQLAVQHEVEVMEAAAAESLSNLNHHKSLFDADLLASNYSNIRFTVFNLDRPPELVCGGVTEPHYSFAGRQLQHMDQLGLERWDLVSFSLLATETGGAAVFAWRSNSDTSARALVDSLLALKKKLQPHALVRFALEHFENTFLAPSWWEGLTPATRKALEIRMSHGASPMFPRESDNLTDDRIRAVKWDIVRVDSNV
jgi:SEC-C motif-containing protein